MNVGEVSQVAAIIYAVETLSLASQGETQRLSPEQFVPAAVRIVQEAERAQGMGAAAYLDAISTALQAEEDAEQPNPPPPDAPDMLDAPNAPMLDGR